MQKAPSIGLLVTTFWLLFGGVTATAAELLTCQLTDAEREQVLSLDLKAFDQDFKGGWRALSNRGCEAEAATLIQKYIARHQPPVREEALLRFHEFQLLEASGHMTDALRVLDHVEALDIERGAPASWRAYEAATRAFVENNSEKFDAALGALEREAASQSLPARFATMLNLNVVRGLRRCFGRPYNEAYLPPCVDVSEVQRINEERQRWTTEHPAS
jgi:hypothetical protein